MTTTIAPERAQSGYALHENEGEAFWLLGMLQTIKIGQDDTGGAYGLAEIVAPEGVGSPWHVHPEEDEWFYVLEGAVTVWIGDTRLSLKAGSFAFGPKGVPHTFYAEAGGAVRRIPTGSRRARPRARPAPAHGGPPRHGAARPDCQAQRVRDPRSPRPAARPLTNSRIPRAASMWALPASPRCSGLRSP